MRRKGQHKFNAKRVEVDGEFFDSQAEATRWRTLRVLQDAGEIANLERQPKFQIDINGQDCGAYKADFAYFHGEERVVEDVKGFETETFKFKRKIVEALFFVRIELVRASDASRFNRRATVRAA
ncbi:MAG: DUF1064 domain-containing protein [Pseudomonadota bacterium]